MLQTTADFSGQTELFDPSSFGWPVHLIGLGGIGSAIAVPLVLLGIRTELHLWDDDSVEAHNLPAQRYRRRDLGRPKAEAMAEILGDYCEPQLKIVTHKQRVGADTPLSGVTISGVDSMQSRQDIWRAIQAVFYDVPFYMDGRMGGEFVHLLSTDPSDPHSTELYEEWLVGDDEVAPLPCAARTVIGPPTVLAGWMAVHFTRFARSLPVTPSRFEEFGDPQTLFADGQRAVNREGEVS